MTTNGGPAFPVDGEQGSNMNKVTAEWLASQGAVYHEPWWQLRNVEVWFSDENAVVAISRLYDGRHEVKTREQVLRMADGGLP
jgi:hypothetical protein